MTTSSTAVRAQLAISGNGKLLRGSRERLEQPSSAHGSLPPISRLRSMSALVVYEIGASSSQDEPYESRGNVPELEDSGQLGCKDSGEKPHRHMSGSQIPRMRRIHRLSVHEEVFTADDWKGRRQPADQSSELGGPTFARAGSHTAVCWIRLQPPRASQWEGNFGRVPLTPSGLCLQYASPFEAEKVRHSTPTRLGKLLGEATPPIAEGQV